MIEKINEQSKTKPPSILEEKINSLIEWKKEYPEIPVIHVPTNTDERLRKHAKTDEEFSMLQEEYKKMQSYYAYLRDQKIRGKLSEEQLAAVSGGCLLESTPTFICPKCGSTEVWGHDMGNYWDCICSKCKHHWYD